MIQRSILCLLLLLSLPAARPSTVQDAPRRLVGLAMRVTLDTVAPPDSSSPARHVGDTDQLRLIYDTSEVDPATKHVRLLNLQHLTATGFDPPGVDPERMPMDDAWLDLSSQPYRVHYRASVSHGEPIVIEFSEATRRLTIRSRGPTHAVRLAGAYSVDPQPLVDDTIAAAARPAGHNP